MTASKKTLVEYRGKMVTPRSKRIYEALAAGMTQKECADTFGVAYGSMSGYAKRAPSGMMPLPQCEQDRRVGK